MSAEVIKKDENVDRWFESLADQALDRNNQSVYIWNKYKDDLEETKTILTWLPKKIKHDVMVPVGPKALMRGKIVHTNEVLVNVGETWFVKRTACQAIEICDRRIEKCNERLEKLEKEKELLESKKSLPSKEEAFGSEERPEIIEYVTEEEEKEWRRQHRIREKEYRQKLAEMRDKQKKPIEKEEDLWNYLDQLELQEELEDELNRLDLDDNEEGNSEEDPIVEEKIDESMELKPSDEDFKQSLSDYDNESSTDGGSQNKSSNSDELKKTRRKVSFAPNIDGCLDTEPLRLTIVHSSNDPILTPFDGVMINSPADIYYAYIKSLNPQSILKKCENIQEEKELEAIKEKELNDDDSNITIDKGIVLPDVIARNVEMKNREGMVNNKENSYQEPARKISKFKASRMKKS